MLLSSDLRNGTIFKYEGATWVVIKYEMVKMGRGSATYKVKAKNLLTNAIVERGFSQNTKFEEASVEKSSGQFLYSDESTAYFMDNHTFEQIEFPKEQVKDLIVFLREADKIVLVYLDEKPIGIEIPRSVILKITYTEPAVKGDTSNNPMKKAEVETAYSLMVPMFVNIGDMVKINTDTGEYSERVNN